jgi:hypothetical protein
VTDNAGFDLQFTSGGDSAERVSFYSGGHAVSALGLPLFARFNVEFDIRHGRIGFNRAPRFARRSLRPAPQALASLGTSSPVQAAP